MKTFREHLLTEASLKDWQGYVNRIPMLKAGVDVLNILSKFGDAYIVGGAVRDIVSGEKEPDDIDISTNVPMEKIESLFDTFDIGANKDFGIVVIKHGGYDMEVAQFRKDDYGADLGKGAASVTIATSYKDDASRRDFTINALAVDAKGNIIDHFQGTKAIQDKVIKSVGDPEKRFGEDYVRMLRAVRFSSRLDFEIEDETMTAIQKNADRIVDIAPERIVKELLKMASQSGTKFAGAIVKLDQSGLLQYIFPEVVKMKEFKHDAEFHPEGGVWDHTLAALRSSKTKDPIINLSILLHDVGKINTHALNDAGRHTYQAHAKESMDLIDAIADRLKLDGKTRKALIFAAGNHMKMHDFFKMSNSKIMKLIGDKNWDVLYNVGMADDKARQHLYKQKVWDDIVKKVEDLTKKYKNKKSQDAIRKMINGQTVMKLRGITKPGPEVGRVIASTMQWILDNNIDPKDVKKINKYIKEA